MLLKIACRIPYVKLLTPCLDKNNATVLNVEGFDPTTIVRHFDMSSETIDKLRKAAFILSPLQNYTAKMVIGIKTLEMYVAGSDVPYNKDMRKELRFLFDNTCLLGPKLTEYDWEIKFVILRQLGMTQDLAHALESIEKRSNLLKSLARWLPLSVRHYSWLKRHLQPSTMWSISDMIDHYLEFIEPGVLKVSNLTDELYKFVDDQQFTVERVINLTSSSKGAVDITREVIVKNRSTWSKIFVLFHLRNDTARVDENFAALNHMKFSYNKITDFFGFIQTNLQAIEDYNITQGWSRKRMR